jgi:two-component system, cell cycle sensor histidine kinase and response regulator CckA
LRILHLEDSESDAELVKSALEFGGVECTIALVQDEVDFRSALEREPFDLILADHGLPTFNGDSALAIKRTLCPDIPLIFVTGALGEDRAIETLKQGATDFVLKDNLSRLAPVVKRALDEAKARRERLEAEEARRRSEERFETVARLTNDVLWELDLRTNQLLWSEGIHKLLGVKPEEVKPDVSWWYERIHPQDRARVEAGLDEVVRAGGQFWSTEYRHVRSDGSHAHVISRAQVIYDERGNPVRAIGAVMDITARLRLEEQFRQAQKMEAIGRLAGGIAHDFNNLLTAINGYTDIVLESGHALNETDKRYLREVRRAGDRAAGLTRQLLAFTRQQVMNPQVIDLNEVVSGVANMLRRLIGEDIRLQAVPASEPVRAKADAGQIEQVLMNLAVNSRDAMPDGGNVTIKTCRREFLHPSSRSGVVIPAGSYVELEVSDTGTGMDTETKLRAPEPFFTTKEEGKGTGLGLSTVYGIVTQSNGHLEIESEPGKGTKVRVYLPLVEQPASGAGVRTRKPDLSRLRGEETILVVEDDDGVRDLTCEILRRHGYQLLEASNGNEALSIAGGRQSPIHLLLTDVVMPALRGPELAQRLRTLHPETRVIFISGYAGKDDQEDVTRQGAPFLQKPFAAETVLRKVRDVLERES